MIIDEKSQISMEEVYSLIEAKMNSLVDYIDKQMPVEFEVSPNSPNIKLTNFTRYGFNLLLENGNSISCDYSPQKLFYLNNSVTEIYDIFCEEQFDNIPDMIGLKNPVLECKDKQGVYDYISFRKLTISEEVKMVFVKNSFMFHKLSEESFDLFFEKYKSSEDIFQREFKSPLEFEPNYNKYFYYLPELLKVPFKIYEDKFIISKPVHFRKMFIKNILDSRAGEKYFYYGFPGTGKSVAIILALKYYLKE